MAAMCPNERGDWLERFAAACDATIVTIVNCQRIDELSWSKGSGEAIDRYLHRREIVDSRHGRVQARLNAGFRTDYDDFTSAELAQDPFYQEFLASVDIGWHATAALPGLGDTLVLSLKRPTSVGPYRAGEIAELDSLLPFLRASAQQSVAIGRSRFHGELDAFERIGRAAICVDRNRRILAINAQVRFGDGLQSRQGRLYAQHPTDEARLIQTVERLYAAVDGFTGATPPAIPVIVRRPGGRRPLMIDVIAIPAGDLADRRQFVACLLVKDLEQQPLPHRELLQQAFGLTPRESELADRLGAGLSLKDAAEQLGISEAHARQRLKVVMAKTGTRRQTQLMALLVRMA
jgi:DNA-binding CsgD family transcriptional regulator